MKSVVMISLANLEGRRSVYPIPARTETFLLGAEPSASFAEERAVRCLSGGRRSRDVLLVFPPFSRSSLCVENPPEQIQRSLCSSLGLSPL